MLNVQFDYVFKEKYKKAVSERKYHTLWDGCILLTWKKTSTWVYIICAWVGYRHRYSRVDTLLLILQYRYRFVELYYRRAESTHKGKLIPARVETVVLFLPDVWSCLPTRLEWDNLQVAYKKQLDRILKVDSQDAVADDEAAVSSTAGGADEKASNLILFFYFP